MVKENIKIFAISINKQEFGVGPFIFPEVGVGVGSSDHRLPSPDCKPMQCNQNVPQSFLILRLDDEGLLLSVKSRT